jgi:hypothetical protein
VSNSDKNGMQVVSEVREIAGRIESNQSGDVASVRLKNGLVAGKQQSVPCRLSGLASPLPENLSLPEQMVQTLLHTFKVQIPGPVPGNDHQIQMIPNFLRLQADHFPNEPFYPVANDSIADLFTDGNPHPESLYLWVMKSIADKLTICYRFPALENPFKILPL